MGKDWSTRSIDQVPHGLLLEVSNPNLSLACTKDERIGIFVETRHLFEPKLLFGLSSDFIFVRQILDYEDVRISRACHNEAVLLIFIESNNTLAVKQHGLGFVESDFI